LTVPPFEVILMAVVAIMPWRNRRAQALNNGVDDVEE
jgi:hypothetical protein